MQTQKNFPGYFLTLDLFSGFCFPYSFSFIFSLAKRRRPGSVRFDVEQSPAGMTLAGFLELNKVASLIPDWFLPHFKSLV